MATEEKSKLHLDFSVSRSKVFQRIWKSLKRIRIPAHLEADEVGRVSVSLDTETSTKTACHSPKGKPKCRETNASWGRGSDYQTEHQKDWLLHSSTPAIELKRLLNKSQLHAVPAEVLVFRAGPTESGRDPVLSGNESGTDKDMIQRERCEKVNPNTTVLVSAKSSRNLNIILNILK